MAGIVRLFGWLAAISGALLSVFTIVGGPTGNSLSVLVGAAYFFSGLFTLALCVTVADTNDRTAAISKHLQLEVKRDDSFRLRR